MSDPQITFIDNGPCKVEGGVTLRDTDGELLEAGEGKPFFLCRCGGSSNKPFCDGTHKDNGFDGRLAGRD